MAYLYDLTDTWNAAGTVFNAIRMNVTNSASAVGSKIVSLQVGSTDRFTVDKDGNGYLSGTLQVVGSVSSPNVYISGNSGTIGMQDNTASILAYNGTGSGGITNALRFITAASERMRIDSTGNVGIGTSSPAERLHVSGNLLVEGASGTICDAIVDMGDQRLVLGSYFEAGVGQHSFISSTNNAETGNSPLLFRTGTTERMRIDSSGNVGIGTASPAYKLDVQTATSDAEVISRVGALTGTNAAATVLLTTGTSNSYVVHKLNDYNGTPLYALGGGPTVGAAYYAFNAHIWTSQSGSERMRIDATGNVGIGTSSPSAKLDVIGSIYSRPGGSAGAIADLTADASSGANGISLAAGFASGGYGPIKLLTSATERVRIDSSGNVGIGTTSPGGGANDRIVAASGSSSAAFQAVGGSVSTQFGSTSAGWGLVNVTSNHPLLISTNNTERMRVTDGGNVGIGTSSVPERLTVSGNGSFTNATYCSVNATSGAVQGQYAANGAAGEVSLRAVSNHPLNFFTNNTERMRVDTSGNLLVNTTAEDANIGGASGTGMQFSARVGFGLRSSINTDVHYWNKYPTGDLHQFRCAGVAVGSIAVTGSATTYNTSSDARLKHDIVDAPEASNLLDAIKVRSFKWNVDGSEQRYGMIAQELLEVVPEAVTTPADPDAMMGVDYSKLVPMLVKELQSLRARVAQLEGK